MPRILVIEDDPLILRGLVDVFKLQGYEVLTARDGVAGLKCGLKEDLDLIVLDLMLPKLDGLEVCRRLREDRLSIPILMLTARAEDTDKVLGLELGADDYVTKPFSVPELAARVKALLRRSVAAEAEDDLKTFSLGALDLDFERYRATRAGKELRLTPREFAILKYLIRHRGKVVTREDLLREVWGYEDPPVTRTVDAHIVMLRRKVERDPARPRYLTSVRSVGYRLEVP